MKKDDWINEKIMFFLFSIRVKFNDSNQSKVVGTGILCGGHPDGIVSGSKISTRIHCQYPHTPVNHQCITQTHTHTHTDVHTHTPAKF